MKEALVLTVQWFHGAHKYSTVQWFHGAHKQTGNIDEILPITSKKSKTNKCDIFLK